MCSIYIYVYTYVCKCKYIDIYIYTYIRAAYTYTWTYAWTYMCEMPSAASPRSFKLQAVELFGNRGFCGLSAQRGILNSLHTAFEGTAKHKHASTDHGSPRVHEPLLLQDRFENHLPIRAERCGNLSSSPGQQAGDPKWASLLKQIPAAVRE